MTESLYYKDAYLSEVWTKVLAVEGKKVLTEKTIFSPKTQEQMGDTGSVDGIPLLGVLKQGEETWHMLERKPELMPGDEAHLKLNLKKRLLSMRLHTALHLLVQILKREFRKYASDMHIDENGAHIEFMQEIDIQTINKAIKSANSMTSAGADIETHVEPESRKKAISLGYLPKFGCEGLFVRNIKEIGAISFSGWDFNDGKFIVSINVESV